MTNEAIKAADASNRKKATTRTLRLALAMSWGSPRDAPNVATTIVKTANPKASMSEMMPISEKYTIQPYYRARINLAPTAPESQPETLMGISQVAFEPEMDPDLYNGLLQLP